MGWRGRTFRGSSPFFFDGTCLYGFVSSCLGDIDNNGVVGVGDVLLLLNFYGSLCE